MDERERTKAIESTMVQIVGVVKARNTAIDEGRKAQLEKQEDGLYERFLSLLPLDSEQAANHIRELDRRVAPYKEI